MFKYNIEDKSYQTFYYELQSNHFKLKCEQDLERILSRVLTAYFNILEEKNRAKFIQHLPGFIIPNEDQRRPFIKKNVKNLNDFAEIVYKMDRNEKTTYYKNSEMALISSIIVLSTLKRYMPENILNLLEMDIR